MRQILIIILFVLLSTNSFAYKKFEKDLKKLSKFNSFIDNKGNPYQIKENLNKDKTIILIYTHGASGKERSIDKCQKKWRKVPPVIYELDGIKIKDFTVKVYKLCFGVRGWSQSEEDKFWGVYDKNNQDVDSVLKLKDKNGIFLVDKSEVSTKKKVLKLKVDDFKDKGFRNILLVGHSAGAWSSLVLKSQYPNQINGVIAFSPARSGKFANKKNPHRGWINWRNYKMSLIKVDKLSKVLVYAHEKDPYENTKTLSFLSEAKTVRFIDLSDTKCKKKTMLGGYHGIHLTKCFAESDPKRKEIIKYLDQIF